MSPLRFEKICGNGIRKKQLLDQSGIYIVQNNMAMVPGVITEKGTGKKGEEKRKKLFKKGGTPP